jgi:outer membrane lipoprotein-sorting protein
MKRTKLFALMIILIMLTACGNARQYEDTFEITRDKFLRATEITFTANIRADYGDSAEDYTLSCAIYEDCASVTVVKPRLISGVTAKLSDGSAELLFDGLVFDTMDVGSSGLSPLSAPAFTIHALREGHIVSLGKNKHGEAVVLTVRVLDSKENTQSILVDINSGLPVSAELYSGGVAVITCDFSDWIIS